MTVPSHMLAVFELMKADIEAHRRQAETGVPPGVFLPIVPADAIAGFEREFREYMGLPAIEDERRIGPSQAERTADTRKPWENIPSIGWNRKAVELWHAGYTSREIVDKIDRDLTPKTILNVISNLRRIYGTEVVPERRSKSRPGRKSG